MNNKHNIWFVALTATAVALLLVAFLLPPLGIIDNSVIAAVGELFGFAALGVGIKAIDKGLNATVSKGDASLTVSGKEE